MFFTWKFSFEVGFLSELGEHFSFPFTFAKKWKCRSPGARCMPGCVCAAPTCIYELERPSEDLSGSEKAVLGAGEAGRGAGGDGREGGRDLPRVSTLFVKKSRSQDHPVLKPTPPHKWGILPAPPPHTHTQWLEIKANAAVCQELKATEQSGE